MTATTCASSFREGARVLELGCATGDLLARLKPSRGVGIDLSARHDRRGAAPTTRASSFIVGDVEDPALHRRASRGRSTTSCSPTPSACSTTSRTRCALLHPLCAGRDAARHRLLLASVGADAVRSPSGSRLRPRQPQSNFISPTDFENILYLADFEPIRTEWRQLMPEAAARPRHRSSTASSRTLPLIRRLCLRRYIVARSLKAMPSPRI